MFDDPEGKTSSSRIIYFMMALIFMCTWAIISVRSGAMVMIDPVWIGILGIPAAQRATQSFAERKQIEEIK